MKERWQIVCQDPARTTIHRLRNFGEELYRELAENRSYEIDLAIIDRTTERIFFFAEKGGRKETRMIVDKLLDAHLMTDECRIDVAAG